MFRRVEYSINYKVKPLEFGWFTSTHPVISLGENSPTSTPVLEPNEYQIEARRFPMRARKTVKLINFYSKYKKKSCLLENS